MSNISFNSQQKTPHEEAKIVSLGSAENHYLKKEFSSPPISQGKTSDIQTMESSKEMEKNLI